MKHVNLRGINGDFAPTQKYSVPNSIVKNWHVCRSEALTVTVGLVPNVCHAAVEQIDQHQSIAVQESVLAAFIARTSLEKQSHVIAYLTGYWCFHEHSSQAVEFPPTSRGP